MDDAMRQRLDDGKACLEAALAYLALGWSVLPLCPKDHVGIGKAHIKDCKTPGKRPWVYWTEFQTRLPTEHEVRKWWEEHENSNVGIALGPVSGLIRIDVEGEAGEAKLTTKSGGDLPKTLEFRSGRADGTGRGLLYRIPPGANIKTTHEQAGVKQELRFQAKGAQTVLPPSIHKDGGKYTWLPGQGPTDMQPAIAPAWLLAELVVPEGGRAGKIRTPQEWSELFGGVEEGGRNDAAAAIAGRLLSSVQDIDNASQIGAMHACLRLWNNLNNPPLPDSEIDATFASIQQAEKAKRKKDDLGAIERFITDQIITAAQQQPSNSSSNGFVPPGKVPASHVPDWHIIVVESEPIEYRLRSPYWKDSPRLKGGYLVLTDDQIIFWHSPSNGIPRAAWKQAGIIVPPTVKNWAKPGGGLDVLLESKEIISSTPESQRKLYVLGFIYRYLMTARPVMNGDGKPHWPSSGRPTQDEDSVSFKLANLKRSVREAKEDFTHREIMALLEEYKFIQAWPERSRWWRISQDTIEQIGLETVEASPDTRNSATDCSKGGVAPF